MLDGIDEPCVGNTCSLLQDVRAHGRWIRANWVHWQATRVFWGLQEAMASLMQLLRLYFHTNHT